MQTPVSSSSPASHRAKSQATQAALNSFKLEAMNRCTWLSPKEPHIAKSSKTEMSSKKLASPCFSAFSHRPAAASKTWWYCSKIVGLNDECWDNKRASLCASTSSAAFSACTPAFCRFGKTPCSLRYSCTSLHVARAPSSSSKDAASKMWENRCNNSKLKLSFVATSLSQRFANAFSAFSASDMPFRRLGKPCEVWKNSSTPTHVAIAPSSSSKDAASKMWENRCNNSKLKLSFVATSLSQRFANAFSAFSASDMPFRRLGKPCEVWKNSSTPTHAAIAPSSSSKDAASKMWENRCNNSRLKVSFVATSLSQRFANAFSAFSASDVPFRLLGKPCEVWKKSSTPTHVANAPSSSSTSAATNKSVYVSNKPADKDSFCVQIRSQRWAR